MAGWLLEETRTMRHRAALRILGAVDQPTYARVTDRASAHGARLQRHIERQAAQPIVASLSPRSAESQNLCVGCRVVQANWLVVRFGHHIAGRGINDNRTDGRLSGSCRRARQFQRPLHHTNVELVGHAAP